MYRVDFMSSGVWNTNYFDSYNEARQEIQAENWELYRMYTRDGRLIEGGSCNV